MRQRIVGDLLDAEISEKQLRSIKYQLTIAKLPLAKDLDDFRFDGTPINETLVCDLARGDFIAQQRNAVLVESVGTGRPGNQRRRTNCGGRSSLISKSSASDAPSLHGSRRNSTMIVALSAAKSAHCASTTSVINEDSSNGTCSPFRCPDHAPTGFEVWIQPKPL